MKKIHSFLIFFSLILAPQLFAITATAGFTGGAIGEYTNNAHQPVNLVTLSTLNITEAIISDDTDDGTFGGTQGNDYDVTLTFRYSNGTVKAFAASVNWRDTQGGTLRGIGLIPVGAVDDGSSYTLTDNSYSKSYVLETTASQYTDDGGLIGSGNAATNGLLDALNNYADNVAASTTPSTLTSTITASDASIDADGTSTTTITVQLKDVNGNNITQGGETVALSTDAGTIGAVTDNNDGTYTATLTSSNAVETATISGTVNGDAINNTASVDFTAVDNTAPEITGPSGAAGDAASAISVNENQTAVTTFSANEAVTWSLTGGADQGKFTIVAGTGVITFQAAPDYENPTDSNTDNDYVVEVTATDSNSNTSAQTLTVTVLDLDDTAPVIGGINIDSNMTSVPENTTAAFTFSSNEAVTWSIPGGIDASLLVINSSGDLSFISSPDYENPKDNNKDNDYELAVRATDLAGNFAEINFIVRVSNNEEALTKLNEISDELQSGLQNYVLRSLGDSLSFNEQQIRNDRDLCISEDEELSWKLSPREESLKTGLNYQKQVTDCKDEQRVYVEAGVISSEHVNSIDDLIERGFVSLTVEKDFENEIKGGVGLRLSFADSTISGFENSSIEDKTTELHAFIIKDIEDSLRVGLFAAIGRASYEFNLEDEGLLLDGKMDGNRKIYGAMLSGDFLVNEQIFTTDFIYTRSSEDVNDALLRTRYLGENIKNIKFHVGNLEADRLSLPISTEFVISTKDITSEVVSDALVSIGLLCEDNPAYTTSLDCGYQASTSYRSRYGDDLSKEVSITYAYEKINKFRRDKLSIGWDSVYGQKSQFELSSNLGMMAQAPGSSLFVELGFRFYLF